MNILSALKNRLQVLNLKKDLKEAKAKASTPIPAAVMFTGSQCLDSISASGEFTGSNWDGLQGMKFALAGIKEAGAPLSIHPTEGISDSSRDYWLQLKQGKSLKTCSGPEMRVSVMAAHRELTAAVAAKKPSESPASGSVDTMASNPKAAAPKCAATVAASTPTPTASKPAMKAVALRPASSPVSAAPKAAPAAYKPGSSPFAKKPSFDHLSGMERATASMKWETDRKAWYLGEAERQVAAEEAAAKVDPTAGQPVTAASIASEIIRQQAEAAKPKPSAWSRESGARRERVAKLAAELAAKDPI
jgi:hypothetical protein